MHFPNLYGQDHPGQSLVVAGSLTAIMIPVLWSIFTEPTVTPKHSPQRRPVAVVHYGAAKPIKAVVDKDGQCLWVRARDGNKRACIDVPNWKELPTEDDEGQFFRGSPLD